MTSNAQRRFILHRRPHFWDPHCSHLKWQPGQSASKQSQTSCLLDLIFPVSSYIDCCPTLRAPAGFAGFTKLYRLFFSRLEFSGLKSARNFELSFWIWSPCPFNLLPAPRCLCCCGCICCGTGAPFLTAMLRGFGVVSDADEAWLDDSSLLDSSSPTNVQIIIVKLGIAPSWRFAYLTGLSKSHLTIRLLTL